MWNQPSELEPIMCDVQTYYAKGFDIDDLEINLEIIFKSVDIK